MKKILVLFGIILIFLAPKNVGAQSTPYINLQGNIWGGSLNGKYAVPLPGLEANVQAKSIILGAGLIFNPYKSHESMGTFQLGKVFRTENKKMRTTNSMESENAFIVSAYFDRTIGKGLKEDPFVYSLYGTGLEYRLPFSRSDESFSYVSFSLMTNTADLKRFNFLFGIKIGVSFNTNPY